MFDFAPMIARLQAAFSGWTVWPNTRKPTSKS
jgi:hypothetical protein